MSFFGRFFGRFFGSFFGQSGDENALPAFDEFSSTLELSDTLTGEVKRGVYVIKRGDRLPSIAGRITAPIGISIEGLTLWMTYRGRGDPEEEIPGEVRTVQVSNDGIVDPDLNIWAWSYDWQEGDTDTPDRYAVGISTEVGGLQITFPNNGWAEFVIQDQLTDDPVP